MNETLLVLTDLLNVSILVAAAIGVMFGMDKRKGRVHDDIQLYIKDLILSFFAAVIFGAIVFELSEKLMASSCAAFLAGYNGYKHTINLLIGILEKFSVKD